MGETIIWLQITQEVPSTSRNFISHFQSLYLIKVLLYFKVVQLGNRKLLFHRRIFHEPHVRKFEKLFQLFLMLT